LKLYIDADHNGYELKHQLSDYLRRSGYDVEDVGSKELVPGDDFPLAADRVVHAMKASHDPEARGILVCASGQGVCMAANRYKGIRASLCWDNYEAKSSRNDDNSNVLCLPARVVDMDKAQAITHVWLHTPFAAAPRFKRRIEQLDELG
jgi:ribose 5-phosphate isomerase B